MWYQSLFVSQWNVWLWNLCLSEVLSGPVSLFSCQAAAMQYVIVLIAIIPCTG